MPRLKTAMFVMLIGLLSAGCETQGDKQSATDPAPEASPSAGEETQGGKHLFILSGQSNMVGLKPDISFTPTVEAALGKENVIVVKDAEGGRPIRRWYRDWAAGNQAKPADNGTLYDRLMTKVNAAIKDEKLKTVTFVWMQGEADANKIGSKLYAQSFRGLMDQLAADLKRNDINFVIGRISDFRSGEKFPDWQAIREIQMQLAEASPRGAWVDTDDLNDGLNSRGNMVHNDLHYVVEGYKTLGLRFAEAALKLIKQNN